MRQLVTEAIILARTDYGEADRILTVLTPDHGKLHLLAKGVRRVKSKLAGGIELFSVSTITFIQGKSDMGTLVSTRLIQHYGKIVADLERTMTGYELIKLLNKTTEDQAEASYFTLLQQAFAALNDAVIALELVRTWFLAQLLALSGYAPNLQTDTDGVKLQEEGRYLFDAPAMTFRVAPQGEFTARHIKYLRLLFAGHAPAILQTVQGSEALCAACQPLVTHIAKIHLRIT